MTWVAAAIPSATVVVAEQGSPRPDTPFASIKVGGLLTVGYDENRSLADPDGAPDPAIQTYRGSREVPVSVQVFGDGALDLARAAARALFTETTRSQLATAGLCPRGSVPAVNDFTGLQETDFEERAQFDATLAFGEDYTDDVDLIERVTGTGTLEGTSATIDIDVQKP